MQNYTLQDFKELLLNHFNDTVKAVKEGDLSKAQFPRIGEVAMVELQTRADVLQWVIEMLPETQQNTGE